MPAPARSRSPPAGGDAARRGGGRAPSWSRHRACAGAPIRPRRVAAVRRHGGAQGPANRRARPAGRGRTASVRRHPRRGRGDERRAVCAGAVPLRPVSPAAAGSATSAGATAGACCVTAIGRRRATTQRMRLPRRNRFPPTGRSDRPRFALPGAAQAAQERRTAIIPMGGVGSPPIRAPWGGAGGPGRRARRPARQNAPPRCTAVLSPSAATDALQSPSQRGVGMMPETSAPYRRAALPATPNRCIVAHPASPPAAAAAERRDRRAKTNPPTRTHARRGGRGRAPTFRSSCPCSRSSCPCSSCSWRPAPPRPGSVARPGGRGRFQERSEGA